MSADESAGNNRDGFERWVASLQRPPGAATTKSDPDLTSALVDESATHVQKIPKELIHRLRERETQGLLGVEVERTAIFKPPPELLARAKRMQPPSKPVPPSEAPEAEQADVPTAPPPAPPPEAAVPTVRPPPPAKVGSLDDDWADMVESGLDALKPIAPRASAPPRPSRPVAPVFSSAAPPLRTSASPRASAVPAVVVARTVAVVKSVEAGSAPAAPLSSSSSPPRMFEAAEAVDEPTVLKKEGFSALIAAPAPISLPSFVRTPAQAFAAVPAPAPAAAEVDAEHAAPRYSGVVPHAAVPHAEEPAHDSLAPEAIESGASGRRWVVIATVFLALVILALAALKR